MAELLTLEEMEALLEDTGGVSVSYGGVSTFGHLESWPDTEHFGGEVAGVLISRNSVVVAADALPDLRIDPIDGVDGIGGQITVGDNVWVVRDVTVGDSDGGTLRIWLGE